MSKLKFVLLPLALTLLLAVDDAQVSSAAPLLATGVPVTVTNTAVPVTGLVRVYGDVAVNRLPVTEHFHRRVPFTADPFAPPSTIVNDRAQVMIVEQVSAYGEHSDLDDVVTMYVVTPVGPGAENWHGVHVLPITRTAGGRLYGNLLTHLVLLPGDALRIYAPTVEHVSLTGHYEPAP